MAVCILANNTQTFRYNNLSDSYNASFTTLHSHNQGFGGPGSSVGIATCWTVPDRIPVLARFSSPVQTGRGTNPASYTMGTGSFPGVKSSRGVTLTPHPLLVPWSRKSRAISLPPPVGRTACTEPQCLYKSAFYLPILPNRDSQIPGGRSLRQLHFVWIKNQLDVTFCILYFFSNNCSTCFGQPCAHLQELTTALCYSLVLVFAVAA